MPPVKNYASMGGDLDSAKNTGDTPRIVVEKCLVCGLERRHRYSKRKKSFYMLFEATYGVDVLEEKNGKLYAYIPCGEHVEEFRKRVLEYLEEYEKARREYHERLRKEKARRREEVLEEALEKLRELVGGLREGEGLVFWVCGGRHNEAEVVKEVFAVVVKTRDGVKRLAGSIDGLLTAYVREGKYASTHYDSQDALYYMGSFKDYKWKAYIQGIMIDEQNIITRLLETIFTLTHEEPTYTLVDFLATSNPRITRILEKYLKDNASEEWVLVEPREIEEKIRRQIIEEKHIDPAKRPHVKDIFGWKL